MNILQGKVAMWYINPINHPSLHLPPLLLQNTISLHKELPYEAAECCQLPASYSAGVEQPDVGKRNVKVRHYVEWDILAFLRHLEHKSSLLLHLNSIVVSEINRSPPNASFILPYLLPNAFPVILPSQGRDTLFTFIRFISFCLTSRLFCLFY